MVLEPSAQGKVFTLCEYAGIDGDIDDPYGGDAEEYEECAKQLYDALEKVADRIESDTHNS